MTKAKTTSSASEASKPQTQAQIVWSQFRKHRLAVWGGRILLVLYTLAVFAGFFSVYDPNYYQTSPPTTNHPPSKIHIRDANGLTRPFVYATRRELDLVTLQPRYIEDPSQGKFYLRFITRTPDQPYTLFKIFKSDVRLLGVDAPGRLFLAGTDNFGRDLWSRLVYGGQVSLSIGIVAAFISFALGIILGGIAGYFSGRPLRLSAPWSGGDALLLRSLSLMAWLAIGALITWLTMRFWQFTPGFSLGDVVVGLLGVGGITLACLAIGSRRVGVDLDDIIMRSVEIISAIPGLFLLISLRATFPPNLDPLLVFYFVTFILGFIGWGGLARVVRGLVLSVREQDYVQAARALGASDGRIIGRHILPSTATFIIVNLSLAIPGAILGESGLSFLGLGITEPYTSWGLLLQSAQQGGFASFADRPWVLWPGFFIFMAVLSWNFLGDGLRDAFDPRKRR
jgi:peptide/nickel transport system permease protein